MNKPKHLRFWCLAVLLAIVAGEGPSLVAWWGMHSAGRLREQVSEAKLLLYIAMQQAALDHQQAPDGNPVSWPADCGATNRDDYLAALVREKYLRPDDLKKIRSTLGDFAIATVSDNDDSRTILIASRSYAEAVLQKKAVARSSYFVVHKGGDGQVHSPGPLDTATLPPHDPPFLVP